MTDAEELARAWAAVEEGRQEDALEILAGLPETIEERFACAAHAWLGLSEPALARESVDALAGYWGPEDPDVVWLDGLVHLAAGAPARALTTLEALEVEDPSWMAEVHAQRALACDFLGDHDRARRELQAAHDTDPEAYPPPRTLSDEEFDALVDLACRALPDEFARVLEEVPIVIEPVPTAELVAGGFPPDLLGLMDSGDDEAPPRILLFQRNLERAFPDPAALAREIRTTIYHELGHALGFDEQGLEEMGLE